MTKDTVTPIQGETGLEAVTPPRSLADIPGLGPIRVRALNKAGWNSVSALRSAKLEALAAVPGMTDIKAQQVYDYLQPFMPEDLIERIETPATESPAKAPANELSGASREPAPGAGQVVQRATRALGEVITVLLSPEAPQFRTRLLRILAQFAQCAESIATDAPYLSEEQQAQAVRRLRRAVKSLSEITGAGAADRKAQGRVADAIEELTAKLAECRLS
jgi:hypothetical protein